MNYKTQETAYDLVKVLAVRTGLTCVYDTSGGEAVCAIGTPLVAGSNSASILVVDQRAGSVDGWKNNAVKNQSVYTSGVAKFLVENQGAPSVAQAASNIAITGVAVIATDTITMTYTPFAVLSVSGVTLTARAAPANQNEFLVGLNDNATMANLAACINAHSVLSQYFHAVAALNVVTVTYKTPGTLGDTLRFLITGGTMTVLAAASGWFYGGTGNAFGLVTANPGTIIATDTITVGSVTFTAIAPGVPTNIQFVADAGGNDDVTLANFVAAVNGNPTTSQFVHATLMVADAPFKTVVVLRALVPGVAGDGIALASTGGTTGVNSFAAGAGSAGATLVWFDGLALIQVMGELARRGMKIELWETDNGTRPAAGNIGSATLVASFEPNPYFALMDRV